MTLILIAADCCALDYSKLEESRSCSDEIENASCFNITVI